MADLKWVKANHDSVRGKFVSDWSRQVGSFNLRVWLPVGAAATVFLPAKDGAQVTECGRPVECAAAVKLLRWETTRAVLAVESGDYEFKSEL